MGAATPALVSRTTIAAVFCAGFAAAGGQVVLLRELLVAAGGNELAAGLALTCWMLATAAGSWIGGRQLGRYDPAKGVSVQRRRKRIAGGMLGSALTLAFALLILSSLRGALLPMGGEIPALHQVLLLALATVGPPGVFLGALFPYFCELLGGRWARSDTVATVFVVEGLGFTVAGALFSLLLVGVLSSAWALTLLALLLVGCAFAVVPKGSSWLAVRAPLIFTGVAMLLSGPRLEERSRHGAEGVAVVDTIHSRVEVRTVQDQVDVYQDGLWSFSFPDAERAQRAVHVAMLAHPEPGSVLLIGGSLTGALEEVLRHPSVQLVDVVEADPGLLEAARVHLPDQATRPLEDPRVRLHESDGRAWIRGASQHYDVILLVLPEPRNTQLNRFYTVEFFTMARRLLEPGGLLSMEVSGVPEMLGPTQATYVASVEATLAQACDSVEALPGPPIRFLCREGDDRVDGEELAQRLRDRGIQAGYVAPLQLTFELGPLRRDYLRQVLDEAGDVPVNRDLEPRCYHHNTVLRSAAQAPWLRDLFMALDRVSPAWLFVVILVWAAVHSLLALRGGAAVARSALSTAVVAVGATGIVLELALILGYQAAFGHLYARIGFIVAAYMAGMAGGAALVALRPPADGRRPVVAVQLGLAVLCGLLWVGARWGGVAWLPGGLELLFPALTAVVGLGAGIHFPCAVQVRAADGRTASRAGTLYALDLAGAAGASLLVSVALFPILGVPLVLALLAVLNLAATVVLVSALRPRT